MEFAVTPERVARASFYNLSLHQAAEANEVGYFGTVSKGSLLEWVDRMYTTPATFADRTVGKWINAVMARGDFLALESRLQLSFKRFGLSCAEPLKHTEFDEYEPRAGCPETRTPYHAPAARDGRAPLRDDQDRMGAMHFLMKTLPRVSGEMALHVLAYNLTRVMNIVASRLLIAAIRA